MTAVRAVAVVAVLVAALLAGGCADDEPPGQKVPELAAQLDKIDEAVADGDLDQARQATRRLVARTAVALADQDIDEEEADRILEAAEALLAQLPEDDGSS